jgi:hypothetical protein
MSVQIGSYSVVLQGNREPGIVRQVYLEAVAGSAGPFLHFAIYFTEQPPQDFGYVNPGDGYVVPFLPLRDFDDLYELLRMEKKLNADWYADNTNKLQWFLISSAADPVSAKPLTRK